MKNFSKVHSTMWQTGHLWTTFRNLSLWQKSNIWIFETISIICLLNIVCEFILIFWHGCFGVFQTLATDPKNWNKKWRSKTTNWRNKQNNIDRLFDRQKLISFHGRKKCLWNNAKGSQKNRWQSWKNLNSCSWWKQCKGFETRCHPWTFTKNIHLRKFGWIVSAPTPQRKHDRSSKTIKTRCELIKTDKKPLKNDVKSTPFFQKQKPDH